MIINVAYACDDVYIEQTTVSLLSLYKNCSHPQNIKVYFIDMGISDESKKDLINLTQNYGSELIIIPFDSIAYDLNISDINGRHIKSVYAKLFFGRIPNINRIIYLDSDTVIVGDIQELWNINLSENICAGVESIHTVEENLRIGYYPNEKAINDGVVLMDLEKWRSENVLEKCMNYIEEMNGTPPILSEGTLNVVCRGKIKIIHPRFNLMSFIVGAKSYKIRILTKRKYYSQKTLDYATHYPCIIHYLSGFYNRPWCKECSHPLKKEYLKYRNMTKWANIPLKDKKLPFRLKAIGFAYKILPIELFVILRNISSLFKRKNGNA